MWLLVNPLLTRAPYKVHLQEVGAATAQLEMKGWVPGELLLFPIPAPHSRGVCAAWALNGAMEIAVPRCFIRGPRATELLFHF